LNLLEKLQTEPIVFFYTKSVIQDCSKHMCVQIIFQKAEKKS
jgi:hypothetical protein